MAGNHRDLISGAVVSAVGAIFALTALVTLPTGTPVRLGPGMFPLAAGLALTVLGLAIMLNALRTGRQESAPASPLRWRPILWISGGILGFALTVRGFGLMPAIFILVWLSREANPGARRLVTLTLAIGLCALCALIFVFALGLPLPLFGPLIKGY